MCLLCTAGSYLDFSKHTAVHNSPGESHVISTITKEPYKIVEPIIAFNRGRLLPSSQTTPSQISFRKTPTMEPEMRSMELFYLSTFQCRGNHYAFEGENEPPFPGPKQSRVSEAYSYTN